MVAKANIAFKCVVEVALSQNGSCNIWINGELVETLTGEDSLTIDEELTAEDIITIQLRSTGDTDEESRMVITGVSVDEIIQEEEEE